MTFEPTHPKASAARYSIRYAKRDKTAVTDIDVAMAFLVREGSPYARMSRLLRRCGFSDEEADSTLKRAYPDFPPTTS